MSSIDADLIRDLVERTQGVRLTPKSAHRLARANASLGRTLDALGAGSLFDTEPAQFDRELRRLGKEANTHG